MKLLNQFHEGWYKKGKEVMTTENSLLFDLYLRCCLIKHITYFLCRLKKKNANVEKLTLLKDNYLCVDLV